MFQNKRIRKRAWNNFIVQTPQFFAPFTFESVLLNVPKIALLQGSFSWPQHLKKLCFTNEKCRWEIACKLPRYGLRKPFELFHDLHLMLYCIWKFLEMQDHIQWRRSSYIWHSIIQIFYSSMYVLMRLHITYLYYYGIYIVSRYNLLNFIITYCIASKVWRSETTTGSVQYYSVAQ